jgi:hypothetical protein
MLRQQSPDFLVHGVVRAIPLKEICTMRGIALQCRFVQNFHAVPLV